MTARPSPLRFEPFVRKLEQAQAEGSLAYVERNMPRLERLIAECIEWQVRIADLASGQVGEATFNVK